jgi:hypothetical protein
MLARPSSSGKPGGSGHGTTGTVVNRHGRAGVPSPAIVLPAKGTYGPGLQPQQVTCETPLVLSTAVTVLAHQGGWDEILMVLTPIAVFALLLKLANSRANRAQAERSASESGPSEPETGEEQARTAGSATTEDDR